MADQTSKRTVLQEFREFAMRGSVIDLAVGVIIGAAFNRIVTSLVDDLIMPPIGALLGKIQFTDLFVVISAPANKPEPAARTLAAYKDAGFVTFNYGQFIQNIISFLLVAFAVFVLVRAINRLRAITEAPPKPGEPVTKQCPYCLTDIPTKATKCAHCTSDLPAVAGA